MRIRLQSAVIAVIIVFSACFSFGVSFVTLHADNLFAVRTEAPTVENPYYRHYSKPGGLNRCIVRDELTGFVLPNCVGYCWGRAYEVLGYRPNLSLGNAWLWYDYNKENGYYPYGSEPQAGAIACWTRDDHKWGHVAFVERVYSDGRVLISESYFNGAVWGTQTFTMAELRAYFGYTFQGFIYIYPNGGPVFVSSPMTSVTLESLPDKTVYDELDPFDPTGFRMDLHYLDGTTAEATKGLYFRGYDNTPGEKKITATYGQYSVTFEVTVNPHEHVFETYTAVNETTHEATCVKCNETVSLSHKSDVGDAYHTDESSHFRVCEDCRAVYDAGDHVSSGEATYDDPEVCTVCGYVIAPVLVRETEPETEPETTETESEMVPEETKPEKETKSSEAVKPTESNRPADPTKQAPVEKTENGEENTSEKSAGNVFWTVVLALLAGAWVFALLWSPLWILKKKGIL